MKFAKKLKVGRAIARRGAKAAVGAGKIASAAGYTGVGSKLQRGGRVARAGSKGQGRKVIKNLAR